MTIQADCLTTYRAFHSSGPRKPQLVRYIVLHDTEGITARSAASYFTEPESGGSSNIVVDDQECYRVLDDLIIPWGAPPLNTSGFHIEQAGYAAWSRREWMMHELTIERAAFKASLRCTRFKIPPLLLGVEQLRTDFSQHQPRGGITTHAVVSAAFGESDHHDPGPNYPLGVFMQHLESFLT